MIRSFLIVFFVLSYLPLNTVAQQDFPTIDGIISQDEWAGDETIIKMSDDSEVQMVIMISEIDIYLLFTFDHSSGLIDNINRDPSTGSHDYFGIEFDNNNDQIIMGNPEFPDDIILFDYEEYGARDMFSHSFQVFYDEDNAGSNDVEGASGQEDQFLIYEVRKTLQSSDENGHDINISEGDRLHIMIAIWEDRNIHSAAGQVNKAINGNNFLEIQLSNTNSTSSEMNISSHDSSISLKTDSEVQIAGFVFYLSGISICMVLGIKRFIQ